MLSRLRERCRSILTRARVERQGTVSIEFAILCPLLLVTLIAGLEVSQAVVAERRVAAAVRTSSDLVSQTPPNEVLTSESIWEVFGAATAVLFPYSSKGFKFTVSRIDVVSRNNVLEARTVWSVAINQGIARPCALLTRAPNNADPSPTTFPAGMHYVGRFIVTDATFTYRSMFATSLLSMPGMNWRTTPNGIEMASTVFMQTRGESSPQYTGEGACSET